MTEHVRQRKRAEELDVPPSKNDRSGDLPLDKDERRTRRQSALPFSYVRPYFPRQHRLEGCCFRLFSQLCLLVVAVMMIGLFIVVHLFLPHEDHLTKQ